MLLNPMFPLIRAYQHVLAGRAIVDWAALSIPLMLGGVLCLLGWQMFRAHGGDIVDEL